MIYYNFNKGRSCLNKNTKNTNNFLKLFCNPKVPSAKCRPMVDGKSPYAKVCQNVFLFFVFIVKQLLSL